MILSSLDHSSLRALVHASPTYHAAYRGARAAVLSQTTFNTLTTRGIDLSCLTPMIDVCVVGATGASYGPPSKHLRLLLHNLYMHYQEMEPLPTIHNLDTQAEIPFLTVGDCMQLLRLMDVKPRPLEYTVHTDIECRISFLPHVPKDEYAFNRRNYRVAYVGEIRGHYETVGFAEVRETPTGRPTEEFMYAAWVYFDHATGEGCTSVSLSGFYGLIGMSVGGLTGLTFSEIRNARGTWIWSGGEAFSPGNWREPGKSEVCPVLAKIMRTLCSGLVWNGGIGYVF